MSEERNSGSSSSKNTGTSRNRDKRFFATIQSALGGGGDSSHGGANRLNKCQTMNNDEEVTLSNALQRISINNNDNTTSLDDVTPFLVQRADQFSMDEFDQLANVLCVSAFEQTNIYFIMEISTELIGHKNFQLSMSRCLKEAIGKFLDGEDEKFNTVPNVLAQFLTNKWPRIHNKAVEGSNLILIAVFNTIVGWIKFLNSKCKEEIPKMENDDNDVLFARCIEGLLVFCNTGQRHLWLNNPELFDNIYNAIVEILTSNVNLPRSVKYSLLNLCQHMMKWSQSNTKKYSHAATQTVKS